jgi:hypothetical protein
MKLGRDIPANPRILLLYPESRQLVLDRQDLARDEFADSISVATPGLAADEWR